MKDSGKLFINGEHVGGYSDMEINDTGKKTNFGDLVKSCEEFSVSMKDIQMNLYNFRTFSNSIKFKLPRKLKKKIFGTRSLRRRLLK